MSKNVLKLTPFFIFLSALFFLLPFERIPTVEIFDFTLKISYLFGILVLVFGASLINVKKITFQKSDIFLSLFLLYSFISIFWSSDPSRAVTIWLLWLFVVLIYKVVASFSFSKEQRKIVIDILLLSTLLVTLFGLYQFIADSLGVSEALTGLRYQYTNEILGFPRIQSVAIEPLYFSNFLLVPLFLSMQRYFKQKEFLNSYFWLTLLIFINIFLGVSRGAYIALAITIIALIIFLFIKKDYRKIIKTSSLAVLSFALSVVLLYALNGPVATKTFFNHIVVGDTGTEVSSLGRLEVYDSALSTSLRKPFGIGVSSWGAEHQGLVDYTNIKSYGNVNNQYLEILVETGFVGLILFILFFVYFVIELFKGYKKGDVGYAQTIMLFLGVVAILIQYNFFSTFYMMYIWVFLGLLKNQRNDR